MDIRVVPTEEGDGQPNPEQDIEMESPDTSTQIDLMESERQTSEGNQVSQLIGPSSSIGQASEGNQEPIQGSESFGPSSATGQAAGDRFRRPVESPQLDSMPAEIIQLIASFLPFESVLGLLKVNRRLCITCNDGAVFKAIIRNGNNQIIIKPWDCDLASKITSPSGWARFALADSRARRWIANGRSGAENEARGSQEALSISDISRWAPQLVALQHPFIAEGDLLGLISKFNSLSTADQDINVIEVKALCIAATILHHGTEAMQGTGPSSSDHLIHENLHQVMLNLISSSQALEPLIHSVMPGLLACALIGNPHRISRELPLPSPSKIPLWSLLDLPLPFSSNGFIKASYPRTMTAPAFLENGEWVGYYSHFMNLEVARFDPPMKGVRFTVTPDLSSNSGVLGLSAGALGLSASGTDSVGNFSLAGDIDQESIIGIRKTYSLGFHWNWIARMTPFGIVGTWGHSGRKHGHVWLWKREWSQMGAISEGWRMARSVGSGSCCCRFNTGPLNAPMFNSQGPMLSNQGPMPQLFSRFENTHPGFERHSPTTSYSQSPHSDLRAGSNRVYLYLQSLRGEVVRNVGKMGGVIDGENEVLVTPQKVYNLVKLTTNRRHSKPRPL